MTEITPDPLQADDSVPFWRDSRVLGVMAQIAFLVMAVAAAGWVLNNVTQNLFSLGESQFLCRDGTSDIRCTFDFLSLDASFDISESVIDYDPSMPYSRALLVGALNTLKVAFFGIILATMLGTVAGIARLSSNWLIASVARWYVDIIRNTPLLLQLFFLFFGVILLFPPISEASQLFGLPIFLSQRGINLPGPVFLPSFATWLAFIMVGIVLSIAVWLLLSRRDEKTGQSSHNLLWMLLVFTFVAGAGWLVSSRAAVNSQAFLTPQASRITEFDDLVKRTRVRLDVDDLDEIEGAVADGTISEEELAEATFTLCTVRDDPSEVNFTTQLRKENVPYRVKRSNDPAGAVGNYQDGDCEMYVAARSTLLSALTTATEMEPSLIVGVDERPLRIAVPRIEGLNFVGGIKLSPSFAAILIGLVVYTGAFIAEIVRAGIQSVPKGQSEAGKALGLTESQRLRLIILPQALRVIIPPLTSQYLNLVKNSSLAIAVGYPDLFSTAFTTLNQSGRAIQVFVIIMVTYLAFSLTISFFLNWYNNRIALVER